MRTVLLHVSGNRFPSLPEEHADLQTWRQLAKGFDEYHMFARAKENRFRQSMLGNIHLHLIPALGSRMWIFFFTSWLLLGYVLKVRPTHILAQCPIFGGLAALAAGRLVGAPVMIELHGEWYFPQARRGATSWLIQRIAAMSLCWCKRVRALSQSMLTCLRDTYGPGIAAKTTIVPVRVNLAVFGPPKTDYASVGPLKIACVGSFVSNKNHLALLRVLIASGLDFQLTLCGTGPLEHEYRERAQQWGVAERLTLHIGLSHAQLADVLREQDLYIHYSLSEALPRAVLEAMAMGLPVIATRVGFLDGAVLDGENGMLIDRPYAEQIKVALLQLGESAELRSRLGRSARATIEKDFEAERVFALYRGCVRTMLLGMEPQ
jgi:glycosyltransferase involved in cell wall biosynthesis